MTTIKKPEWFFYPGWVVLTTFALPVAFALTFIILDLVVQVVGATVMINGRSRITEDWLFGYIFIPVLGLTTGFLQYLLLRHYLPRMGKWVGATTLGWLLAAVIVFFLRLFLIERFLRANVDWLALLMITLIAGSVSFMQWLILRRRVPHAGWWIPATIAGWIAMRLVTGGETTSGPMDIWYLGVLPAIATSAALWLLLAPLPPLPKT